MKKRNLFALLLTCALLLPCFTLFVSATEPTAKVLTSTTQLTSGTKVSSWGTPTIDGTRDSLYKEYSLSKGNYDWANTDAAFDVWYANDGDYLYFYVDGATPFDKTKQAVGGNDFVSLYVDFYNQHTQIYNAPNNAYMTAYFSDTTDNGGRYTVYPVSGGVAVDAFKNGVKNVDFIVKLNTTVKAGDAYSCRYTVEARVPLPDYIKTAISSGQQPIIGACLRAETRGPASCVMTFDSEMFGPNNSGNSYTNNVSKDFTLIPDLVLSNSTASNRTILFEQKATGVIADLNGKQVTVDGVRNEAEGWSALPTAYLSNWTANVDVNSGSPLTTMSGFVPRVWMSADTDYLYFFYETDTLNAYFATFQIGFGSATDEFSKDLFTEIRIRMQKNDRGTYNLGAFTITDKTNELNFRSKYSAGAYKAGDALFDNVEYIMKADTARNVIEMKVPIPETVKAARQNGDFDIKVNVFERKEASTGASGYMWAKQFGWGNIFNTVTLSSTAVPRVIGYQTTEVVDEKYNLRITAVMDDYTLLDQAGFVLKYVAGPDTDKVGKTAEVNCYSVYESILAAGEEISAVNYGGKYFFCFTIEGLDANENYTFEATCRVLEKADTANWVTGATESIQLSK